MKTEDLVGALVADLRVTKPFRRVFAGAMALGALIALGVFLSLIGVRSDIAHAVETPRFLMKLGFALLLAAATTGLLLRLSVPGASPGRWAFAWLAAPALLALAVVAELAVMPGAGWGQRLVGTNARMCLAIIPLLATGPLACLLLALRQGAPSRPGLAGAVAGLVAGGVAATLYAAHCIDDSPLFVATWYTLAIGFVALAGYAAGSRLLRW